MGWRLCALVLTLFSEVSARAVLAPPNSLAASAFINNTSAKRITLKFCWLPFCKAGNHQGLGYIRLLIVPGIVTSGRDRITLRCSFAPENNGSISPGIICLNKSLPDQQ